MPPTTIHSPPALDSFTSLADHQSQTPATFYNAKPVLHYHATGVRALASQVHVSKLPVFTQDANGTVTNSGAERAIQVELVDAYVSSEHLTLFNTTTSTGLSIPYPAVSLHAIQTMNDPSNPTAMVQGLYMQLDLSDENGGGGDGEELDAVELTLIPLPDPDAGSEIQKLFEAVSNCSNLHPDPMDEEEDMEDADGDSRIVFEGSVGYEGIRGLPGVQQGASDGGLPPPFPGSGGWITAENVSEYFDADGNWIGGEVQVLGEGAGRTRTREEMDGDGTNGYNGDESEESEDNKRPRTD